MSEKTAKKPSKAQVIDKLVKQFTLFREKENPISKRTGNPTWLKKAIKGLDSVQLVKTVDGNLLINIKDSQRYGVFFDKNNEYSRFLELMNQKAKIEIVLEAIMKVNGISTDEDDLVIEV